MFTECYIFVVTNLQINGFRYPDKYREFIIYLVSSSKMESADIVIRQNDFLRQFESDIKDQLIAIEYSDNERNLFLSKVKFAQEVHDEVIVDLFIKAVLDHLKEKEMTIVPTSPFVKKFIKMNKLRYKKMLPVGMAI